MYDLNMSLSKDRKINKIDSKILTQIYNYIIFSLNKDSINFKPVRVEVC